METRESMLARLDYYDAKADALLSKGDALGSTHPAESRRTLRECRRYRLKALELRKRLGIPART